MTYRVTICLDQPAVTATAPVENVCHDPDGAIRILVVDDSRLQRRILMSALRSSDYILSEAASGEEALEHCRVHQPDIVISDWIMPGMTGLELCTAVRAERADDYVYFIILTSKSEKEELAQALNTGADDFLSKPFAAGELRSRLAAGERLLRMSQELREKNRLISTTLQKMQEMNAALDRDLLEARKLQVSLAPRVPLKCGGWTVSFALHPSGHIGGDLIGSFPAGPDRLGIYCFDVSGHGIASALIAARLATWMSEVASDQHVALRPSKNGRRMLPPTEVCARLNARFLDQVDTDHYFTALVGELDLHNGHFIFAQAGHPHPVLQTAQNERTLIGQGGPPIGLLPEVSFEQFDAVIPPGGRLLLYSDGVTECPSPNGEMLDEDGLLDFMDRHAALGGDILLDSLDKELIAWAADSDLPDDMSATLIERSA